MIPKTKPSNCWMPLFLPPQKSPFAVFSFSDSIQKALLLYDLKGLADHLAALVEDGEIFAHIPKVASDESLQLEAEIRQCLLEFCLTFF